MEFYIERDPHDLIGHGEKVCFHYCNRCSHLHVCFLLSI